MVKLIGWRLGTDYLTAKGTYSARRQDAQQ